VIVLRFKEIVLNFSFNRFSDCCVVLLTVRKSVIRPLRISMTLEITAALSVLDAAQLPTLNIIVSVKIFARKKLNETVRLVKCKHSTFLMSFESS
jgi:hypothetical protein